MGPPPVPKADPQEQKIMKLAQTIKTSLNLLLGLDPASLGSDLKQSVSIRLFLVDKFLQRLASEPQNPPEAAVAERTFKVLPPPPDGAPQAHHDIVQATNEDIIEFPTLYMPFISKLKAQPPPSLYAEPEVWEHYQEHGQPIMCLRPHDKRGVPLVMLHQVFRQFAVQAAKPLPSTSIAFKAKRVAHDLCRWMPDRYKDESTRRTQFNEITECIIKWWSEQVITARSEVHGGIVDAWHINANNRVLIIREDRVEPGLGGGDPYMQASRDYQILVSRVKEETPLLIEEGNPVFILTVVGPQLWVCGGFWDGEFPVVEPLAPPCIMLPDFMEKRENMLARILYALCQSIDYLDTTPLLSRSFKPGVPRVFQSYQPFGDDPQAITFIKRFHPSPYDCLMFIAEVYKSQTPVQVLVKFRSDGYGVVVHRHLATLSLAPAYHGHITLEGTPTGHVMEFLKPPATDQTGWITLFEFGSEFKPQAAAYHRAIRSSLDQLLGALEAKSLVHGDLRSNNILIEVNAQGVPQVSDGAAHIRVVDFDWAGTSGEARYPESLNPNIQWPASAGDLIVCGHDREMVETWWGQEFSSED